MSRYRIAIGRISHESNSFFRRGTTMEDFESFAGGVATGDTLLARPDRTDEITGFLDVFADHEPVPLLSAATPPSGPVTQGAVDTLEGTLRRQLRRAGRLDGICFALHGAMSGESIQDLDGHFLRVMREEAGPGIPIVCALDCHAVVTRQMLELATALTGYRTHPHTDVVETGARAARMLLDALDGRTTPTMACEKVPMLLMDPGTAALPLKRLFDRFIAWDEADGVIAGSLFPSFPCQDVAEQGWAALAVTDNDGERAARLARELASEVWGARHSLLPEPMLAPEEAVRRAAALPGRPILVVDAADNVGAGAPGDTPAILRAILDAGREADGLVLANIPDAEAVATARASGKGATISLEVGGKRDGRFGRPVPVTAQVLCVEEGAITDDGEFGSTPTIDAGGIVCLGVGNARMVLTEHAIQGPQPSLFRKVGIEPFDAAIVAVKSGIGYKTTYGHVAKGTVQADCPGPGTRNLGTLEFKHIPRPMFPLDPDTEWNATR